MTPESTPRPALTLDVDAICRLAAEEHLDRQDIEALADQIRRLLGEELLGWYVRIEGREEMVPLTLFALTRVAVGEFSLGQRARTARIVPLRHVAAYEERRRTLLNRPPSWRSDRLSAITLTIWTIPGALQPTGTSFVLTEEVRQYPPAYDPDYTLVDILADFADTFARAYRALSFS